MTKETERIVLGSGKTYVVEFEGDIPEHSVIETGENMIGLIQGGATLEYKPEYYTAEDDLGLVKKIILTKETATFKTGVMTWNGKTLQRLCATARVTDDVTKKMRTVKIGGAGKQDGKKYIIRFVHEDQEDGDIRITIVGKNESGFSFVFAKDKETVIDAQFSATPIDDEGTLIIFEEAVAGVVEP